MESIRRLSNPSGVSAQASVPGYDRLSDDKKNELKKLESACNDFESIFVMQMMKEMRKTVHKTGLVSGGMAENIFTDMVDQERSKTAPVGVGQILFKELARAIVPPTRKPR